MEPQKDHIHLPVLTVLELVTAQHVDGFPEAASLTFVNRHDSVTVEALN